MNLAYADQKRNDIATGTTDRDTAASSSPDSDDLQPPAGFDPRQHRIIAAHFFNIIVVEAAA